MGKILRILPILVLPMLLASCLDYVQSVSKSGDECRIYCKISLSRDAVEGSDFDPDAVLGSLGGGMPKSAKVRAISTKFEVGREATMKIAGDTKDKAEAALLPKADGKKLLVPFLLGNVAGQFVEVLSYEAEDTQKIWLMLLQTSKCRVLIDKKIAGSVKRAYFLGKDGGRLKVPVYDYGTAHCAEVPFMPLLENGEYEIGHLIIETK